jgi:3-hydroxybutyryl-CoA dehydrogenase
MQTGWKNPGRFVLGHPFNPPHLIPLVELLANDRTDADVIGKAERFYRDVGKITIRVSKEVPGHVANRLQAALWREALHLVKSGVATVKDVDTAVWAGPGLRWAAMGPTTLFHLAAGPGGIAEFCDRYTASFNRWWDDLGDLHMDKGLAKQVSDGIAQEFGSETTAELSAKRDALIIAMQKAIAHLQRT